MSKEKFNFPEFPNNPDPQETMIDSAIKNAADLYLNEIATSSQKIFITLNWTIMVPIIQSLVMTGILQGWELRGLDCKDCPFEK